MLQPPEPSVTVRMFRKCFRWTTELSRREAWEITLVGFGLTALLDAVTGTSLSMALPYLILVCFAAWTLREKVAFGLVAATILVINLVNGFGNAHPTEGLGVSAGAAAFNSASRAIAAVLIVILVATLRHTLDREKWRASTDAMTGALNRRAFLQSIDQAAHIADRSGDTLLLAYMDLDGFKGVNDQHGHAAGDAVLRAFAAAARGRIRGNDVFARLGGDEFAALLTLKPGTVAEALAERFHARLTDALRETGLPVTCSMGAVIVGGSVARDGEALVGLADELMLEVKRSGKAALRIAFAGEAELRAARSVEPMVLKVAA